MDYTQVIGNTNELRCMLAFIQLGYECSVPYGNGAKYDFIADTPKGLLRIQCKSSHYVSHQGVIDTQAIVFACTCQTSNTKETKRYTYNDSQIDYFATSFDNKVYLVPVNECSGSKTLRLAPPKNNIQQYNNAEDYLIERVLGVSEILQDSEEKYRNRQVITKKGLQAIGNTKKYYCKNCGKEISGTKATYCVECARINSRKCERPDRETLKKLIRTTPFTQIGSIYNVSDNTVKKWCKAYSLPHLVSDIRKYTEEDWIVV